MEDQSQPDQQPPLRRFDEPTGSIDDTSTAKAARDTRPARAALERRAVRAGQPSPARIDWSLVEALIVRWRWLLIGSVSVAAFFALLGLARWSTNYIAISKLMRYESPNNEEIFRPRQVEPQTFALMLRSPELLRRVASLIDPAETPGRLATRVRVAPEFNSDLLAIAVQDANPQRAVEIANIFAREGVRYTQELQKAEAAEIEAYLAAQLADTDARLRALNAQWLTLPPAAAASVEPKGGQRPLPLIARWQTARDELIELLTRYTEAHPVVKAQRNKLATIEKELATMGVQPGREAEKPDAVKAGIAPAGTTQSSVDPEMLRSQLQAVEATRLVLASRLGAARIFQHSPPGYLRMFAEASAEDVAAQSPRLRVIIFSAFGALLGFATVAGVILLSELRDPNLKTSRDLTRVTQLPVLASLGDLYKLNATARSRWAFRTWTALQSRLGRSPNQGLVCGITSSTTGEGRSLWTRLLAQAASQCGFRVLTISTQPTPVGSAPPAKGNGARQAEAAESESHVLTANALAAPDEVALRLTGDGASPLVHIPLPGWVWNRERREQWQDALARWSSIENVVIIVELPPADLPESVLLAQNLPNLIWLAGSGRANAVETRQQIATLQHARCDLVGAVLNNEPPSVLRNLFPRWLSPLNQPSLSN